MFLGKANCLVCGQEFIKRHSRHQFHNRKCFLIHRYKSLMSQNVAYRCLNCGAAVYLGFDPKKKYQLWNAFKCPICNMAPGEVNHDGLTVYQSLTIHYVTMQTTVSG